MAGENTPPGRNESHQVPDKMNKKVMTLIIVIVVVVLCVLAVIYAPSLLKLISSLHTVPQH